MTIDINHKNNSVVIIDLKDNTKNYDIVHIHKMRDKSLKNITKRFK